MAELKSITKNLPWGFRAGGESPLPIQTMLLAVGQEPYDPAWQRGTSCVGPAFLPSDITRVTELRCKGCLQLVLPRWKD